VTLWLAELKYMLGRQSSAATAAANDRTVFLILRGSRWPIRTPAPKPGDKCPNCGGDFVPRAQPTDAQRAAAKDRDNPVPLPPFADSADPAQIAELGALHECARCHYLTRIKADKPRARRRAPRAATSSAAAAAWWSARFPRRRRSVSARVNPRRRCSTTAAAPKCCASRSIR
jgi:hypothetical protein